MANGLVNGRHHEKVNLWDLFNHFCHLRNPLSYQQRDGKRVIFNRKHGCLLEEIAIIKYLVFVLSNPLEQPVSLSSSALTTLESTVKALTFTPFLTYVTKDLFSTRSVKRLFDYAKRRHLTLLTVKALTFTSFLISSTTVLFSTRDCLTMSPSLTINFVNFQPAVLAVRFFQLS